jgi:hypothetical protein
MAEQDDLYNKQLSRLDYEYQRISKQLDEVAFRILDLGGSLPSEAECEAAVNDAKKITTAQIGQVYLLEVNWRSLIIEAMKQIPNPCALKNITEQIVLNNKSLKISTTHNHVRVYMNFLVAAKEVGELHRGEKKYFLR